MTTPQPGNELGRTTILDGAQTPAGREARAPWTAIAPEIQAKILLEAGPFVRMYRNQIFVVKYGGSFMDDTNPAHQQQVLGDIGCLYHYGILPVVVHGGGKAISKAFERAGIRAEFIDGERVTKTQEAVAIVDEVLSGQINGNIVDLLGAQGFPAERLPGPKVLTCRKRQFAPGQDLGFVGEISDVNVDVIRSCIMAGRIPVISPTAAGPGGIYNCNADVAAAKIAQALAAKRLIFMSDVEGLMTDPKDPATLISETTASRVESLMGTTIKGGMIPKMRSALDACEAGVEVSLVDGRRDHVLLREVLTKEGIGTIIRNEHES